MPRDEGWRGTLGALRATRNARRVATDVRLSPLKDLRTERCRACGQRFSLDPAATSPPTAVDPSRLLCPTCRRRRAAPAQPSRVLGYSTLPDGVCLINAAEAAPLAPPMASPPPPPAPPSLFARLRRRFRLWLDDVDDRRRAGPR